ncbi:MAG TPA: neuraminidase-like domain-containing protein, partial [Ktedonobacterales bacterium]|nr:neuraminidase-like domain-containing protein [Ktedonobacterales bacterium]
YGEFLTDATKKLADHAEAVRSAFNLTADEYTRIVAALGYDANTSLTIANISAIYRRGWLARKLRLSVRELLLFTALTGLDPFAAPDPTAPAILRLIALMQALKDRSLRSAAALYLIWNQDLSGKSAPAPAQITELARTLRNDYADIENQFATIEDPNGDIAHTRMALVYGQETADAFFALLDDTLVLDVPYTHPTPTLEPAITAVDSKLAYDDFSHRLVHTGVLSAATRDALKLVPGVLPAFQQAMGALFDSSEDVKGSFFTRYPELKPLYDAYIISPDPLDKKRSSLLAAFQPALARLRKRQQAVQRLSTAATTDPAFIQAILDASSAPYPLHAAGHADQPALNDVLALETPGLATQFFYRDTATGAVDMSVAASANLDYSASGGNPLPANPTPGNAVSGIWQGSVETPEAGFYNIVIEADATATVTLSFSGQAQPLTQNGTIWRNTNPLQLQAGTLYDISLTVEKVKDTLSVKWETPKRPREVLPGRYLYPPGILPLFSDVYIRFLKVASLAMGLGLTANEMAHFATDADYQIAGDGWLNALPVTGDPTAPTAAALLKPLQGFLDFVRIKADISPGDEQLLTVLEDPVAASATPDGLLYTLTRWDAASLASLLNQFGGAIAGLARLDLFRRVYDAFALLQTMGIAGAALIQATTNEPTGDTVRALQAALRARYADADWRTVVQPINDDIRGLQRDALVAHILHQMRSNPATEQIDTPDKLFEYFLMDVQMDPCMQTSRIRHALSSVQLFIEHCLMNLEPRVSLASSTADQWAWMKRYRVWEANRKVFLWPENWLEPEL